MAAISDNDLEGVAFALFKAQAKADGLEVSMEDFMLLHPKAREGDAMLARAALVEFLTNPPQSALAKTDDDLPLHVNLRAIAAALSGR